MLFSSLPTPGRVFQLLELWGAEATYILPLIVQVAPIDALFVSNVDPTRATLFWAMCSLSEMWGGWESGICLGHGIHAFDFLPHEFYEFSKGGLCLNMTSLHGVFGNTVHWTNVEKAPNYLMTFLIFPWSSAGITCLGEFPDYLCGHLDYLLTSFKNKPQDIFFWSEDGCPPSV